EVEPYRQLLVLVLEQLKRTRAGQTGGYPSAREFVEDLESITESLMAHQGERIADGEIADVLCRARVFGFHLAELEIRQHSRRHFQAIDEILRVTDICPD